MKLIVTLLVMIALNAALAGGSDGEPGIGINSDPSKLETKKDR